MSKVRVCHATQVSWNLQRMMVYSNSENHGCNWLCKFMAFSHMSRLVFKHIAVWVWIVHISVESLILKLTWKLIGTLIIAYLIFDFLVYKWCCTSARVSVFSARTVLTTMTTKCSMLLRMAVFSKLIARSVDFSLISG